ncbi:MAG: M23 family metallopeptidase [Patescibacteria group bacterium]
MSIEQPIAVQTEQEVSDKEEKLGTVQTIYFPVDGYLSRRTFKSFGEYIEDRFTGYHVADDIEFTDVTDDVPVVSIAEGTVRRAEHISGYGGLVIIRHTLPTGEVNALYGHLDLANTKLQVGDVVAAGSRVGVLGQGGSTATDGERKHLHFGLYSGEDVRLQGYEKIASRVASWINPTDFFTDNGVVLEEQGRMFDQKSERDGEEFPIQFWLPRGAEVEYVPQIKALNVFSLSGSGTARERSLFFIRFFDADSFQTLSTVMVHSKENTVVGAEQYSARRYDIEKKDSATDFPFQPLWRNERHIVTDVTTGSGFRRYYVVAKNPTISEDTYKDFLKSLVILK